ncbi:MAG TPA: long-chain-fatty-acid--CoA ligase [Pseudomonas sabulinigri]|jgi:long-chain acyl-CoA synthetase|uniref:Long-chain-fatty-acid--CoA ligase n=1 Tax=marine sediment metagenome TaxID=412755 RepID=A0A0F9XQF9_9ZZZZ|nr:long-chain-fatty-acid--CoA ligase [Halopseudomonas sabulinigri]HEC51638.1 long-chain-fatty-acid--CoA ligase [Halopseudomonas sabulinigri]|tara:strand:- start:2223 stop:3911 length:1689 start_codon:yes stop_codon:yes gene_type:complete
MDASFWDDKRPAGIPATIDLTQYSSIIDVFQQACAKHGDRPAFSNMGVTLSYADLDRHSAAFASYLQQHTTLQPGDRIAVQMPNVLQFPIAVYGAIRAGLVVVNTNPLYTAREMRHQFQDSGARALIFMNMFGHLVQEVLPDTEIEFLFEARIGDMLPGLKGVITNAAVKYVKKIVPDYQLPQAVSFKKALKQCAGQTPNAVKKTLDDVAVLQYTGGTTGVAKGAMLTHGNLVANMLQVYATMQQVGKDGQKITKDSGEVIIAPLPLYHIFAFTVNCMCMMIAGHHNVLITNPRDIPGFVAELKKWPFSSVVGLNTLFVALMDDPEFANIDFSHLKSTGSGGTALVKATAERWEKKTGCKIGEGYGLTECSPVVTSSPGDGLARIGTVGLAAVGTALKVINEEGAELGIGERGELCVKGPQVMKGYWNRPESTEEVLDADGWFRTGDVAVIDADGFVSIVDRIKDLIIVSGFNVYPNEIEDVVAAHPKVANAAAIGIPDEKSGEAVKLFVVANSPDLTVDELKAYCRANFTGYKVPKYYEMRESLPMSAVGKILRRELRDKE